MLFDSGYNVWIKPAEFRQKLEEARLNILAFLTVVTMYGLNQLSLDKNRRS